MMWGYGFEMGWMWLWGVFLLAGIAVLVILAIRLLTGGIDRGGPGPGVPPPPPHHAPGQFPPPGQYAQPGQAAPSGSPPAPPAQGRSQARLILDERFARGEVSAEQYRESLKVLGEEP
jgi:putative membrane protein